MKEEAIYTLALNSIPGIGNVLLKQLVAYSGSPSEAFKASKKLLTKIPGIGPSLISSLESEKKDALLRAEKEAEAIEKEGGFMVHYLEQDYPVRLKSIPDAPPVLFGKGTFHFEAQHTLAIVGTRQATSYGKQAIESFLEELQPYKPVIVSGLAYGIDIAAHKTALQMGMETWGVMATGIDQIYPSAHKQTAQAMLSNGGILTENPLKTKPDAPRFPARNRIIAGLADAIWVVEAMEKGGALITAHLGSDYFRDVFALPGNIAQKASSGCNELIRKNIAGIVLSGSQLAESMGWQLENETGFRKKRKKERPEGLSDPEIRILDLMDLNGEILMDEIAWRTQIPINQLASMLLNLEFQGLVKSLPGKRFGPMV